MADKDEQTQNRRAGERDDPERCLHKHLGEESTPYPAHLTYLTYPAFQKSYATPNWSARGLVNAVP